MTRHEAILVAVKMIRERHIEGIRDEARAAADVKMRAVKANCSSTLFFTFGCLSPSAPDISGDQVVSIHVRTAPKVRVDVVFSHSVVLASDALPILRIYTQIAELARDIEAELLRLDIAS